MSARQVVARSEFHGKEWQSFRGSPVPRRDDPFEVGHDFVRALHHHICQPITAIRCSLELMQMYPGTSRIISEQLTAVIDQTDCAIDTMSAFRQLFDAECPAAGCIHVDVREVLAEVVEDLKPVAISQDCELRMTVPCSNAALYVSKPILRQALWNLLENCIHLSAPQNEIDVALHVSSDAVLIEVCDQTEITEQEIENIFDPFSYVQNPATKVRVKNLPLAIMQRLMVVCGGEATVALREAGRGREFALQFKISRGKEIDIPGTQQEQEGGMHP